MDVKCIMNTYTKDGMSNTILKVESVPFDHDKVRIRMITPDNAPISAVVVGDEMIKAVERCMLDWRGH